MGAYTQYDAGVTAVSNILDDIAKRQSDRLAKEMNDIINNQMKSLYAEEMKSYSKDVNTQLSNIRLSLDTLDNNKNEILKKHQDGSAYTEDEKKQIQNIEATEAELKKEKADLFNSYYNNGFEFQTQDTKWVCTMCGAKNPIGASVCTVCNGKKPDDNHIMFDKASTDITNTVSKPDTVNLAFNNKADVRKFAIDMEKQGVKCVIIAEKMNHQYLVMVDNKNMPAVKKYSSDEHMSIHEFKDYDVSGISALATSGEVSHFYGRTIKSEFYTTTDAGKAIAKYNRNSRMVKNFLKGRFGTPSSFEVRRRGWDSLEDTVINHNRGQANGLADQHFREALKEYDPRTHQFTGHYKTTDEVLTKINDKWGKPFGNDVYLNKNNSPIMYKPTEQDGLRVVSKNSPNAKHLELHSMKNLSYSMDNIILMRTRIMNEYADVLNIKAGKFGGMGHLDKNQLMALKKGMSIKENRLGIGGKMPSEEEIDFLLMTADEGKDHHRIKGAFGIMRTALRYSSTGNGIYQVEKVISRTQQIYKVTKAGKKLIYDNAKRKVQVVRLRNAMNNPDKAKKKADKMLAKKTKAKPKQVKKANRKVKKNRKKIARMERRDRRRLAFANTKVGKFGRNVSKVNRSVKRAVQRSPIGRMAKGISDFVDKIKKKVFKKIALILGVPILGAICIILICLLLSGILSAIASFFAADTPQETMIYHIYEDLDDAQQDWIEEGRDPDKLWDKRKNLKYGSLEMYQNDCGSSYLSWEDYINSLSAVDVYDDDGNVSTAFKAKMFLDADGKLWVNPFGDMEWMEDVAEDINKEIDEYEEYGCEWDVIPYGTTAHNNNIKDILCMTEVRYEHNIKEGTFGQDFQDTKFVWNVKNVLNDIGNFFQSIGDWFSGSTENPDEYEQTRSYGTICSYALNLWAMSHQTSIELEVRVLKAVTEEELEAKYGSDYDKFATPEALWKSGKCPEVGGCMTADIFFIDDNGTLCLMKSNGTLQQIYTATKDIEDSCAIPDFLQTEDGQNATDEEIFEWCKGTDDCWEQAPTPTPYHTPWTNTGSYSTTDGVITVPSVTPTPKVEYTINNALVIKKTTKYEYQVASNQGSVPTSEPAPTQSTSPSQGTSAPTPTGTIITPSGTIIPTNIDAVITHTDDLSDYRYWSEVTDDDLYKSQGIDKTRYVLLQRGNMFRLISRDKWDEYLEQEKKDSMPNACMGNPIPCSTPTPIPTRKNETYASRGSSTPTPTTANTNTPTPTATSAPTDTPTPTSTATPTPTPVTYYQLQTRTYVEEERYAHNCSFDNRNDGKGEHDGYYCGGHIVAKVHGIVYGISENYLETEEGDIAEAKNPEPDKNKGLIYNANYKGDCKWAINYWVSPEGVWVDDGFDKGDKNNSYFLTRLPNCDDIFDIDLAVRYGNGLFPIHQAQWYKYDGWNNTTINLAVMKYKADWVGMYGFDIPENFGISPLSRKDIDNIVTGLKGYYGEDKITEKREETVRLILSCVGHGQYDMLHHGHCYKFYDWCSSGKNCTKTDCSGFCSYILLEEGLISGAMDTGSLHDGQQRWYGNVRDATIVEPGDCIIKWGGQTSWVAQQTGSGRGSHALMYIGCLNEETELTNGWIIPAGVPLVVDCLQMGEQYDANCGNIYLRLAIDGSNDDYGETLQGIAMSFPSYLARSDNDGYEMYVRKIE